MRDIGFSTGALAKGDFVSALKALAALRVSAVELSALREDELPSLMDALSQLDLSSYSYVSVHAPSRLRTMSEVEVVKALQPAVQRGWPVILHPDAIQDHECWRDFGSLLCIENMDKRKPSGRTVAELEPHFEALPEASLCLDLGHARQVDPTLGVARSIIRAFGSRLTQIHLSELDVRARHHPLSMVSVRAFREIAHLVPPCPVILESVVPPTSIHAEVDMARKCFEFTASSHPHPAVPRAPACSG